MHLLGEGDRQSWPRMRLLRSGYRAAAIMIAASGTADRKFVGRRSRGIVTIVRVANATGMLRGCGDGSCHRDECSGQSEKK
jgi:hypothetical protein